MKQFHSACWFALMAACLTTMSVAGEVKNEANMTAKWIVAQETAWAEQECTHKSILADLLADDFMGASPKGNRYNKAQAMAESASSTSQATDCRLLHTDVRFFGASTAVIYGSETAVETSPNEKPERHCLIWTDTWLKRGGKWQIVAAQDTAFKCPAM